MLATLVEPHALPGGWIYEPKLDGWRCLAVAGPGGAHLFSRNRKSLDDAYPELVEALRRAARGPGIYDGEIVAIDPRTGISSFSQLHRRIPGTKGARSRRTGTSIELWLFDALWYEGLDLRQLPLVDRKAVLRDAIRFGGALRFTPAVNGTFAELYGKACAHGEEGLIGKRADSPYVSGRSADWVKLKCVNEQELVIGGWTDPRGSRTSFGALLVGYYEDGELRYAGKVGTGFDAKTLQLLERKLRPLARSTTPFTSVTKKSLLPRSTEVHWVKPTLVGQFGFAEWTPDGLLRHPRFLGLRDDKAAADVEREVRR
ncbi:MAG: non-homologous end-joining DNA ligase [Gemmatimonadota bacterium]